MRRFNSKAAIVLLLLTVYAFLVNATHYHRLERPLHSPLAARVAGGSEPAHSSGQDGAPHCLLCQLQREFVSDPAYSLVSLVAPLSVSAHRTSFVDSYRYLACLSLSSRAPPRI